MIRTILTALALVISAPAMAGPTEKALAACRGSAEASAPGAEVSIRKIVEGRSTLVSLWVKGETKRVYDCRIAPRGELTAAYAGDAAKTAVADIR